MEMQKWLCYLWTLQGQPAFQFSGLLKVLLSTHEAESDKLSTGGGSTGENNRLSPLPSHPSVYTEPEEPQEQAMDQ